MIANSRPALERKIIVSYAFPSTLPAVNCRLSWSFKILQIDKPSSFSDFSIFLSIGVFLCLTLNDLFPIWMIRLQVNSLSFRDGQVLIYGLKMYLLSTMSKFLEFIGGRRLVFEQLILHAL